MINKSPMYKAVCTCKNCGKKAVVDDEVVLASYPPKYSYKCPYCGDSGYIFCSEARYKRI